MKSVRLFLKKVKIKVLVHIILIFEFLLFGGEFQGKCLSPLQISALNSFGARRTSNLKFKQKVSSFFLEIYKTMYNR